MKCLFEGAGVAIVTPFKNGNIDYYSFKKLIQEDLKKGAKAIIVLGTTGEGVTVNGEERNEIIQFAKNIIDGRAKLIVGTGHNNFSTCVLNTQFAKKYGADGVLVVTPYYNKTTQKGLIEYYQRLAEIGIPIIMYNVPARTGMNIEIETVKKLLNCDMIYGLKESSNDLNRIVDLARVCNGKIALYSGEDSLNYLFYCLGANGCISVTANVMADKVQAVYDAVKRGDLKEGFKIQEEMAEINKAMFVETNPIPIKNFMAQLNMIDDEVRMPLVKAEDKTVSLLLKLADKLKQDKDLSL